MKDLILATSYGYSYAQLHPFLRSLKNTGYAGDIVLFAGRTDFASQNRLRREGVQLLPLFYPFGNAHKMRNPLHRLWPVAHPLLVGIKNPALLALLALPFQNLSVLRYFLYHRFLKSRAGVYRSIFLTDLRDVCFQRNPSEHVEPGKLRVYVEEPPLTVGTCPNNSRWIREGFGEATLRQLADKPIVCSGTTLGDYVTIVRYLEKMILALRQVRSVMRVGLDQGMHNYLVRLEMASDVTLCCNRESEVLTMGLMPREENFPRNDRMELIDRQGRPYAVLHQFDRHEGLKSEILARYSI